MKGEERIGLITFWYASGHLCRNILLCCSSSTCILLKCCRVTVANYVTFLSLVMSVLWFAFPRTKTSSKQKQAKVFCLNMILLWTNFLENTDTVEYKVEMKHTFSFLCAYSILLKPVSQVWSQSLRCFVITLSLCCLTPRGCVYGIMWKFSVLKKSFVSATNHQN